MHLKRLLPDPVSGLAIGSGLLLALAFPRPDVASLAWFALVPLFIVMSERPFQTGFLAGAGFFGLVLYWLNIVMTTYGRLHPVLSMVAYLLLVAYLSLFFGAATWAACFCRKKLGLSTIITLPVFWVALEFLRSFLLTGFPWATLGYSQQSHLPLIQSADLFGPYGLSFLLILSNAALARAGREIQQRRFSNLPWTALLITASLFAANLEYGFFRLDQKLDERSTSAETLLVQGCIDQSVKWDPAYQARTIAIYQNLSFPKGEGNTPAELIIWPESAVPFFFQEGGPLAEAVLQVPVQTDAHLLLGSPAYEVTKDGERYLNSAFLLSSEGRVLGRSDKVHLVPFGEYVPFGRLLPFVDKLVVGIGDFSPGMVSPLRMNGARIGVLVCFEGIFPELARDYVRQGSDLLVNITNDAWFGRSSAPYQHLAMSRFRAVENRIWVARAANTGISAFVSPTGRIVAQSPLFERTALRGQVGLGAHPTLYTRFGDVLAWVCLIVSAGLIIYASLPSGAGKRH